jgi:hypothetical protein
VSRQSPLFSLADGNPLNRQGPPIVAWNLLVEEWGLPVDVVTVRKGKRPK